MAFLSKGTELKGIAPHLRSSSVGDVLRGEGDKGRPWDKVTVKEHL